MSLLIWSLRPCWSHPCWSPLSCCPPPAESATAESSCSASPAESSSSAGSASPTESSSSVGSAKPAKSSSSVGSATTAESGGLPESSPVAESAASAGPVTSAESSSAAGRAAAFLFCLCFRALSNPAHASGNQSLQTSHGDSLVHSLSPSLRQHCWQRWWLSLRNLKCEQPGNLSCSSCEDDRSHGSAILLCWQTANDFPRKSELKKSFMPNVTWKNTYSCDRLASEVSSH